MNLFLDTNIFIIVLNQQSHWRTAQKLLQDIHSGKYHGFTSVICIAEILSGFYSNNERKRGEDFLIIVSAINNMKIIDINLIIAKRAAEIRGAYNIKLPDALIASSCEMYQCTLITEVKDFTRIPEVTVKSLKEF